MSVQLLKGAVTQAPNQDIRLELQLRKPLLHVCVVSVLSQHM